MAWLPMTQEEIASLCGDLSVEDQVGVLEQDLRKHLDLIRNLPAEGDVASHVEILAFSLLDSLGYLLNPQNKTGGGKRIRDFIETLPSHEDFTRLSVPALLSLLRASDDTTLQALQDRCQELFDLHWDPGSLSLPRIQMDLSESEFMELTGCRRDLQVDLNSGTSIELGQCKHSRMLAEKRNALAHQLIKKGLRAVVTDTEPYYIWCASDDDSNAPGDWDLVYPVKFLLNLCEDGIVAACSHLRMKEVSPYHLLLRNASWLRS